jgi:hypothetical protein
MPHDGRRRKTNRPTSLLDAPADIDIVTGNTENGIESTDFLQEGFAECHVATRNMLSDGIS